MLARLEEKRTVGSNMLRPRQLRRPGTKKERTGSICSRVLNGYCTWILAAEHNSVQVSFQAIASLAALA